jgi:hypothetical protein
MLSGSSYVKHRFNSIKVHLKGKRMQEKAAQKPRKQPIYSNTTIYTCGMLHMYLGMYYTCVYKKRNKEELTSI